MLTTLDGASSPAVARATTTISPLTGGIIPDKVSPTMATTATAPVKIPFTVTGGATGWLQQIADLYVKAYNGDATAAKTIQTVASYTDAQWQQAHPDMGTDVHKYDYARNAYKAAYTALQEHAKQTAAATTPVKTTTPAPASSASSLVWIVVAVVAVWVVYRFLK